MRLFRALRSDEIPLLIKNGIEARCNDCNDDPPPNKHCCDITDNAHVQSGSRAIIKSRYISTTEDVGVAAWYCSNASGNPSSSKSATLVELHESYDENYMIKTCQQETYGTTAKNRAKASCEVLIMDYIPPENIIHVLRVRTILKHIYDALPDESYEKNGFYFQKITGFAQQHEKYMLVWLVWSKNNDIEFDIETEKFPDDFIPDDVILEPIIRQSKKRSPTTNIENDELIGSKIQKIFDGKLYNGKITRKNRQYYKVRYTDGDEEEMDRKEVMQHLVKKPKIKNGCGIRSGAEEYGENKKIIQRKTRRKI